MTLIIKVIHPENPDLYNYLLQRYGPPTSDEIIEQLPSGLLYIKLIENFLKQSEVHLHQKD